MIFLKGNGISSRIFLIAFVLFIILILFPGGPGGWNIVNSGGVAFDGRNGWECVSAEPVEPAAAKRARVVEAEQRPMFSGRQGLISETDATPEIEELARALHYDPIMIYDYIRNNFDYVPTFGSVNGATGAYYAGRGNDCDLASLFIGLMRESGFDANYVIGDVWYEPDVLANWLGVEENIYAVINVLARGGIPVLPYPWPHPVLITRVWATAAIEGTDYVFDPAMKQYDVTQGIDVGSATGFDYTAFIDQAMEGASTGDYYIQDINENNIRSAVSAYSMNLADHIEQQMPEGGMQDLLGCRSIIMSDTESLPTTLPSAYAVDSQTIYAELPQSMRHTISIEHHGIDIEFNTYELTGKRVTIFYRESDNAPQLFIEGEVIDTGNPTTPGELYDMTLAIDHPYAAMEGEYGDQEADITLVSGSSYAVITSFESASEKLISRREKALNRSAYYSEEEDSEPVLGETMNVVGLNWSLQCRRFNKITGKLSGVVSVQHHQAGIVGQQEGYFISIPMEMMSVTSIEDDQQASRDAYRAMMVMGSALEHSILEQRQGSEHPAVSSVRLLQMNNEAGSRTYLADQDNWAEVQEQIHDYEEPVLDLIDAYIDAGYKAVLPENGNIEYIEWTGAGFILYRLSGDGVSIRTLVGGHYFGGWSVERGQMNSLLSRFLYRLTYDACYTWLDLLSNEPVDMTTGAYVMDATDLAVPKMDPDGWGFTRYYNSGRNYSPGLLGLGWSHRYEMSAQTVTNPNPVLGSRSPVDASSAVTAAYVLKSLLDDQAELQAWMIASCTAKWCADQLLDNAVSISLGDRNFLFSQLADGSYWAPPGIGFTLHNQGGGWAVADYSGSIFQFDAEGRIESWADNNQNTMNFTYNVDGDLDTVTDSHNRTLTFEYEEGFIERIVDNAGRSVSYVYTDDLLTGIVDPGGNTWTYGYDAENRMSSMANPLSNTLVVNHYDFADRVEYQEDVFGTAFDTFYLSGFRNEQENAYGESTTYVYGPQGNLIRTIDPVGNSIYYEYDGHGRMTLQTDRLGGESRFAYHPVTGEITEKTNPQGHTTTYDYQPRSAASKLSGRDNGFYDLASVEFPDGSSEQYIYDDNGNILTRITRLGDTWTYTYNGQGRLATSTNPKNGVITNLYNIDGALIQVHDPELGAIQYSYDQLGRRTRIRFPDNSNYLAEYDVFGRLTEETDERGNTYIYEFDSAGNKTRVIDPALQSIEYRYDQMNRLTTLFDKRGSPTHYGYDLMGRMTSSTDATGFTTTFGFNDRGLRNSLGIDGQEWITGFDAEGVAVAETSPEGRNFSYLTDALGHVTEARDPLLNSTIFERDELGRTTKVIDPDQKSSQFQFNDSTDIISIIVQGLPATGYEYNLLGQLSDLTDLNGEIWQFEYSAMGRKTVMSDPNGSSWLMEYDSRGRQSNVVFPDSAVLDITYDDAGNLTKRSFAGAFDLNYAYDELNRLTSTDGISFEYDQEGNVTQTYNADGKAFGAEYDAAGRLTRLTYDDELFYVQYSYDPNKGYLTGLSDSLTGANMQFQYDGDFRITRINRSNGVNTSYEWDDAGRLTSIQHGSLGSIDMTLNPAGLTVSRNTDLPLEPADLVASENIGYLYDAACQLITTGFEYDARGRLTTMPETTFEWDAAGRLTAIGDTLLSYNGLNALSSREMTGGDTSNYYYNRAIVQFPIITEQKTGSGEMMRYYVALPSGRLVYLIESTTTDTVSFFHFDESGNTLFLTDTQGMVTDSYAYSPYGSLLEHIGTNDQPFTFAGEFGVRNEENDGTLYHMGMRYYDAVTQRFLSREPVWPDIHQPLKINPYQYAKLNPVTYSDPLGTDPTESKKKKTLIDKAIDQGKKFAADQVVDTTLTTIAEKAIGATGRYIAGPISIILTSDAELGVGSERSDADRNRDKYHRSITDALEKLDYAVEMYKQTGGYYPELRKGEVPADYAERLSYGPQVIKDVFLGKYHYYNLRTLTPTVAQTEDAARQVQDLTARLQQQNYNDALEEVISDYIGLYVKNIPLLNAEKELWKAYETGMGLNYYKERQAFLEEMETWSDRQALEFINKMLHSRYR